MSTYIVAFAVGDYRKAEKINEDGTLIRIWGWPGQEGYLQWAADTASECIHKLGVYAGFKYPYIKSDMLGMPEFVAGAMENYGLIIYKYQYIAFNEQVHTTKVQEMAAETICHELAHQWFGDTVTSEWWSDLFLNEGFATYFQAVGQKLTYPSQSKYLDGKFAVNTQQRAFFHDAIIGYSHPIYDMNGPLFDDITYAKGGSMLKMIESVLGPKVFQTALQNYIQKYKFSTATHEQLFEEFTMEAQKEGVMDWCGNEMNVSRFLDPWFLQQSFPLVSLKNAELMPSSTLTLSQQPFNAIDTLPVNESVFNYAWPIPFYYHNYANNYLDPQSKQLQWIVPDYMVCPIKNHPISRSTHWEMGNAELNTFVRVEYDDEGYARLMKQLTTRRDIDFSTADKVALIGDQLAFAARDEASGGRFSFRKVLELLTTILPDYQDFATFKISQELIDGVERLFMDGPDYPLFKKAIARWFGEDYDKMGYNVTGDWDMDMLSYLMLPYPVRYDVSDSNQKAAVLFQQFLKSCESTTTVIDDCNHVKPDLRIPMYCAGVRLGSQADFERMLTIFDNQEHNEYYFYHEYYSMLQGLSCSPRREDIMKVIPRSLKAFRMPHKKKYFVPTLSFIAMYPAGSQWLAEYLEANPVEVMSSVNFEEYLTWMTSSWYSQRRVDQYAALKKKLLVKATTDEQRTLLDKYENATITQLDWHQKHYPDILKIFYDSFSYGPKEVEYWVDRLPQGTVKPIQYNITLRPYFNSSAHYPWYKELTFEASVDIELEVEQKPKELKLNANRMLISAADIVLTSQTDNSKTTFASISKNIDSAFLIIPLPDALSMPPKSKWTLSIKYTGFIYPEGTNGVYLNSNYFEFNDKKAFIFSTFFEKGPSARSLVPCFDEPAFKAKWQVTIDHPADMIALSNMPSQGFTVHRDGWATTRFPPTLPMSSYLFAVAVGHFASVETVSESGVLVRAWAWTGMERYGDFALKLVSGSVDFMSNYFGIPFMLPKLDAIALPKFNDRVGAEEHWGLMHFSYTTELVDPLYADGWDYFWVGSYLGHETVHQWFGDLVTTEFFDKMFLNEAMAQYWETTVIVETYPEQWRVGHFERFRKGMDGFREDSPPINSHAIVHKNPPYSTGIIYDKGATLMHMLKHTVGDKAFQMGLKTYLKRYSFGNANDVQLWQEITDACKQAQCQGWNGPLDVKTLMDTWIYQASYPVLKLTTNGNTVTYTQEPFIPNPQAVHGASKFDYKWIIPVQSKTALGTSLHFFRGVDGTDPFFKRQLNGWQVENANFTGFYRVWYDDATWAPILQQLKSNPLVFDENTRASFIADAAALRERGSVSWSRLLDTAFTLQNEGELAPWFAFAKTFDYLIEIFRGTSEWNKFKNFANKILTNVYAKVAWKKWSDWSQDKLATHITEWACAVDLPGCRETAKQATMNFAVNCLRSKSGTGLCNTVSPNVRRSQYCWGTRVGADSNNVVGKMYDWFVMNSKYFARDSDKLLEAQACTTNTAKLNNLIADTLAGKLPSKMLKYLAIHDETRQLLWNEFERNTNLIIYGNPSVEDYVKTAMSVWTTVADVDQASQFLQGAGSSKLSPADRVMMETAITTARTRVTKAEADKKEVVQWLNANIQAFFE